jgi:uncharacterized protein YdcH (DUF465 family)
MLIEPNEENMGSIENRMEALVRKHRELDQRIIALEAERAPDKYINPLKKEKLLLKDEITQTEKLLLEG